MRRFRGGGGAGASARARASAPEPGNHSLMKLRDDGFSTTLQSVKPAACDGVAGRLRCSR